MKLGLIDYKQVNNNANLIDTTIPNRVYAAEKALYDELGQLGQQMAVLGSKREEREATTAHKERVSAAQTVFDENETLTKEHLDALGVDAEAVGLDPEAEEWNTWEIQGVVMEDILNRSADQVGKDIWLPGYSARAKGAVEANNIDVLAATRADAQNKMLKHETDAQKAHVMRVAVSNPDEIEDALEDSPLLTEVEKNKARADAEYNQLSSWANDTIQTKDIDALKQGMAYLISDELRSTSHLDEDQRTRLMNRMGAEVSRLESDLAGDTANPENQAKISFAANHLEAQNALASVESTANMFMTGNEESFQIAAANLQAMRDKQKELIELDEDDLAQTGMSTKIDAMEKALNMAYYKVQFNDKPYDESLAYIRSGDLEPEVAEELEKHIKARRANARTDGFRMAQDSGVIDPEKDIADRTDLDNAQKMFGVNIPSRPQEVIDDVIYELESGRLTTDEWIATALDVTRDPGFMYQLKSIDTPVKKQLAAVASMSHDPALQRQIVIGLRRTDLQVDSEDLRNRKGIVLDRHGELYRDHPTRFDTYQKAAEGVWKAGGMEEDYEDVAERIFPGVAELDSGKALVPPGIDPEVLEDYVDNLTVHELEAYDFPKNIPKEHALRIVQNGSLEMVENGYYVRVGSDYVKYADGEPWLLPFGKDQKNNLEALSAMDHMATKGLSYVERLIANSRDKQSPKPNVRKRKR